VLRSDAAVPTRRRSSRASWGTEGAATTASKGSRSAAVAAESQQVAMAVEPQHAVAAPSAAATTAVTTPLVPPAPAPTEDSRAAVLEIPDDDVPPPGWDQWVSLPRQPPSPQRGRS
jgi:hypothetical protein